MITQQITVLIANKSELKQVLSDTKLKYYEDVIMLRNKDKVKVVKDRTGYFAQNVWNVRR